MIDLVMVLDGDYPHAYEWTARSRAASLNGYAIAARPFHVELEVMGSGPSAATAPSLKGTVEIECSPGHMIRAEWLNRSANEATNWVAWNFR